MQKIDLSKIPKEPILNYTSKGNQPKWHIDNKWYKADHMGYEALAEFAVSELLKKSNISDFVSYALVTVKLDEDEKIGCVSDNFRGKNELLIPIEKLHRQFFGIGLSMALANKETVRDRIQYTVDFIEEITGIKSVGQYFTVLLAVDAFFLNEDRHTNNIAVIRNEETGQFRMAPIFDNGLSLLSDLNDYPISQDIYVNIKKVHAKPFSADFDEQLDAAEELYGAQVRFSFTKSDVRTIVYDLADIYCEEIICRVEDILLEQMRRYSVYFLI